MSNPRISLRWFVPGLVIVLCSLSGSAQVDVHALARKVDQHYDRIRSLEMGIGKFEEIPGRGLEDFLKKVSG